MHIYDTPVAFETRIFQRTYATTATEPREYVKAFIRERIMHEVERETGQRLEPRIEWSEGDSRLTAHVQFKYLVRVDG